MCAKLIGAGILAIDKQTGRILMCRRGMKTDSPNCWSFFGGTFELKDGIPRNTAIREFKEESGCAVEYLLSKKPFYVKVAEKRVLYYEIRPLVGKGKKRCGRAALLTVEREIDADKLVAWLNKLNQESFAFFLDLFKKSAEVRAVIEKLYEAQTLFTLDPYADVHPEHQTRQ